MANPLAESALVAARAADNFVPAYYKVCDRQRHLMHQFYREISTLLWNGNPVPGRDCGEFFLKLPATDHIIHTYDAQPVLDRGQILVTVNGTVKYGAHAQAQTKAFAQVFVLSPDVTSIQKGQYFIGSDHFRFT
ncbi:uncharacterized protein EV422DRAFT_70713 [Fimicolochytrium jonesii]|uniref:uncharacterized protein n=1 Tax=Fimicolochytrium jonesii TaxID=1396493 RepID=UPI0022FEB043|nr:uncharacterized protein EV422DRAFT_70713 [Fimicolochytrium jonesii]KAI8820454.1 hypothetical protein EV422DRAFT_70713 [Fimicolochytrium jonesii]